MPLAAFFFLIVDLSERSPPCSPWLWSNQVPPPRTKLSESNASTDAKQKRKRSGEDASTNGSFHTALASRVSIVRRSVRRSVRRFVAQKVADLFLLSFSSLNLLFQTQNRSSRSSSCSRSCSRPPSRRRPPTCTRRASAARSSPTTR